MTLDIRILLVEDDPAIVKSLLPSLVAAGSSVTCASTAREALERLGSDRFDVVLTDLGLPDRDGKDVIREVRRSLDLPIIVLSARANERERIETLDLGADDYISKPYSIGELLARIRAALRRRVLARSDRHIISAGSVAVDLKVRRAILDGEEIRLTGREHSLLCVLARNAGNPVPHEEIIEAVWGDGRKVDAQHVRVLVGQLRQKLEADPSRPEVLRTEAGVGYSLAKG